MKGDKKNNTIIPYILDVLKNNTDENHTMTQKQILDSLERDHNIIVDRRTVGRNLHTIEDMDENVRYSRVDDSGRPVTDDYEGRTKRTDFYYRQEFEKSELLAVIYNIVFSKHMSSSHKNDIIEKLAELNPFVKKSIPKAYIRKDRDSIKNYSDLFLKMELLDDAVARKRVVEFRYASYGDDLMLRADETLWKVVPFGIAEKDNDFYLIGYIYGRSEISADEMITDMKRRIEDAKKGSTFLNTFRIDRIKDLTVTENEELSDSEKKYLKDFTLDKISSDWQNVRDFVGQNSTLSSGRRITAKFRMREGWAGGLTDAVDFFGKDNIRVRVSNETRTEQPTPGGYAKEPYEVTDTTYLFTVTTNDRAMLEFAKSHMNEVEIMAPEYLKDDYTEMLKKAYERMAGIK